VTAKTERREVAALKVRQWIKVWDKVEFSDHEHRKRPDAYFYLFSLPAVELRNLCGIARRNASDLTPRAADLGIQREHDPERSSEIWRFVEYGYPWSTLSEAKQKTAEFNDLRKPGWLIAPYGRTLDGWLTPLGGGNVVSPQAQVWFRQWGMDLRTFPDDRDARNISSYRPDGIPSSWYQAAPDVLNFVRDVWSAFQPAENARFDGIDKYILRITLESTFRGRTGTEPNADRGAFKIWLHNIVDYQAFSPEISAHWTKILNRETVPDDPVMFSCSAASAEVRESSHFSIMSRAALLLRIASGSTARLVQRSGLTPDSIQFWWNGFGQARGLWEGQREADTLTDLWADIEVCLSEIDDFESRNSLAQQTFYRIGKELGPALAGLASCERVAIWGIAN
jgi:hypothetical protein